MFIIRMIALIFIVLALMLLGADIVTTLEHDGAVTVRSLLQILMLVNADPTAWLEKSLQQPSLGILTTILGFPSWTVTGLIGILLALISVRREAPKSPPPEVHDEH